MDAADVTASLIDGLERALSDAAEQRLFRLGKLAGLFPSRTGVHAEAAALAVREGLLDVVRTEVKGKQSIEWVRLTPLGIAFLHERRAPDRALQNLRAIVTAAREALPAWQAEVLQTLQGLASRVTEECHRYDQRLETLIHRVDDALRRLEELRQALPEGIAAQVPWGADAALYLDRRRAGGVADPCPLPELFAAVCKAHSDLSVAAFHAGLRWLEEHRVVRLLPFTQPADLLPHPEYALLDRGGMLYYAAR